MRARDLERDITLPQLAQFYILTSPFVMFISNGWLQTKIASYYVKKAKWQLGFFKERKFRYQETEEYINRNIK